MASFSSQPALPEPSSIREAEDRFIAVWGQMAGAWGVSRTMAEVHALLYITGQLLCTDDVMDRLAISRGNASMSLRSLVDWGIITRETRRGDRKEYFKAEQDVWSLFRAIVRERMNREVDPLLASLHEIRDMTGRDMTGRDMTGRDMTGKDARPDAALSNEQRARLSDHRDRLDEMLAFFETLEAVGQKFVRPSGKGLRLAATLLTKLPSLPEGGRSRRGARTQQTGEGRP